MKIVKPVRRLHYIHEQSPTSSLRSKAMFFRPLDLLFEFWHVPKEWIKCINEKKILLFHWRIVLGKGYRHSLSPGWLCATSQSRTWEMSPKYIVIFRRVAVRGIEKSILSVQFASVVLFIFLRKTHKKILALFVRRWRRQFLFFKIMVN